MTNIVLHLNLFGFGTDLIFVFFCNITFAAKVTLADQLTSVVWSVPNAEIIEIPFHWSLLSGNTPVSKISPELALTSLSNSFYISRINVFDGILTKIFFTIKQNPVMKTFKSIFSQHFFLLGFLRYVIGLCFHLLAKKDVSFTQLNRSVYPD